MKFSPPLLNAVTPKSSVILFVLALEISAADASKEIKVSMGNVSRWFSNQRQPSPTHLVLLWLIALLKLHAIKEFYQKQDTTALVEAWAKQNRVKLHPQWREEVATQLTSCDQLFENARDEIMQLDKGDMVSAFELAMKLGIISAINRDRLALCLEEDPQTRANAFVGLVQGKNIPEQYQNELRGLLIAGGVELSGQSQTTKRSPGRPRKMRTE